MIEDVEKSNKIFGQLVEKLQPAKPVAPYPYRTIFASLMILLVHNPLMVCGTALLIMLFWNWFLPAIGVAAITYPVAFGLYLLFQVASWKISAGENKQSEALTQALLSSPLLTLLLKFISSMIKLSGWLGAGYIIHLVL